MNKWMDKCIDARLQERVDNNKTKREKREPRQREQHERSPETGNSLDCLGNLSSDPKKGSSRGWTKRMRNKTSFIIGMMIVDQFLSRSGLLRVQYVHRLLCDLILIQEDSGEAWEPLVLTGSPAVAGPGTTLWVAKHWEVVESTDEF